MYERLESLFMAKVKKNRKYFLFALLAKHNNSHKTLKYIALYTLHFLIIYRIKIRLIEQIRLSHECKIEGFFIAWMKKTEKAFYSLLWQSTKDVSVTFF